MVVDRKRFHQGNPHDNGEKPAVNEEEEAYGEDANVTKLIQRLIYNYYRGDAEKKAHLIGLIIGADLRELNKNYSS